MTDDLREKVAQAIAELRAVDYDTIFPCDYETADAVLAVVEKEGALQKLADEGQAWDKEG